MIGENRHMTFSYHIDYKLGSTVKTATGSNEDLLLQVRESDHRLQVTLHPTAPIQVRSFILELPFLFTPASRFMANGFQSWTDSREFGPTERMSGLGTVGKSPIGRRLGMQYTGDYTFVPEEKQAGVFHSHGFAYVRTGDMLDFIGSLTDRTGFTVITADMNRNVLAVSKDLEGLMLTEDYPVLDLYMQQGHYDAVFDGYFAALGVHPRQTEKLRGYTSWYNYYSNINHNIIMHDLRAIAPCAGVNTFQVDDGYQTAVGDWLSVDSKKFPFGMRRVADAVHQRGLKAGLWLAPFAVQKNAYLAKKHPGWLVADKKGSPLMVGANWGGFYALDIYHKEARAYIKQVFQTVLHTWGFDMVKLDFLYAASVKPLYGKTRGQVAYDAMELLRECVGEDKLLLACGAPMLPSFGVADYMRIGADMALSWPHSARRRQMHREDVSTPNAMLNSVYRRGLNGRAFLNDPDVFLLRRNNISFTPEQQALLAKFIQLFGGVLFTSDDVSTYKPEQASLFADTLADTATLTDVSQEDDVLTVRYTQSDRPCTMQFNVYTGQIFAFGADEK